MKQKKMTLQVFDESGVQMYFQSPSSPDALLAALQLFGDNGNKIVVTIEEVALVSQATN